MLTPQPLPPLQSLKSKTVSNSASDNRSDKYSNVPDPANIMLRISLAQTRT